MKNDETPEFLSSDNHKSLLYKSRLNFIEANKCAKLLAFFEILTAFFFVNSGKSLIEFKYIIICLILFFVFDILQISLLEFSTNDSEKLAHDNNTSPSLNK